VKNAGRGVLEGAFALMEALEKAGAAGLTALAAESGLPKTSAHRLLEQLLELGAVERSGSVYRMGARVFRLGRNWQPYPGLLAAAHGPLRRLAAVTGATVAIVVLSEGRTMAVTGVPGEVADLVQVRPGTTWPWSTAAGKVLVAFAPPGLPLDPAPASWRRTAGAIRARGAAFDREELVPGVCCAAVPIRGRRGEVVASLCGLVGPERDLEPLADTLTRASRTISDVLRRTAPVPAVTIRPTGARRAAGAPVPEADAGAGTGAAPPGSGGA
jgi:IclR family transcriptional regulator, acetate operon repressor